MRSINFRGLIRGLFALALVGAAGRAEAAPYFQEVPNAFGMQPCNGTGCWTNYLRLTDIDGDKDLDVIFPNASGFFKKGASAQPLVIYTNDGTAKFTDVSAAAVGGYSNWIRQVAMGDVDLDGDLDMYVPSAWGDPDKFFINDGSGIFTDEAAMRLPGVSSTAGAARFGDVDNDGDLDLLVSAQWNAQNANVVGKLYLNDSKGVFTDASNQLPTTKIGSQPDDFDLLDADGDFDLDLLITMHVGTSSLWINDGKGTFADAPFPMQTNGAYKYGPAVCDVDGDNDLDIWFDNEGPNYTEQLLINDGSGAFTDETVARVTGNPGADDNGVACIDIDGDGDFDAAIMSLSNNERVLVNDGTGKFDGAGIPDAFPAVSDPTLWFEFGDLNGDGRLDVVTGQGEGNPQLNRVYIGTMNAPVDTVPPKFRAVEAVSDVMIGDAPVVRFAVSDNATTDEGARLQKAFVQVTTSNTMDEVPAIYMGGDLYRAVMPAATEAGEVSYEACAVDMHGNKGCAPAKIYTVQGGGGAGGAGGAGVGGAGVGGAGVGGGATSSSSASGAGGGASSSGGEGGATDFELNDSDSSCGCALPGDDSGASRAAGGAALFAALALYGYRRRSRGGRRQA